MTITVGTGINVSSGITIDGPLGTPVLPGPGPTWTSVAYGNGRYVAVAQQDNGAATGQSAISSQGSSWISTTMPTGNWTNIVYGADKFVAISTGTVAAYSYDGITWTSSTLPSNIGWTNVAYGNGLYVAMGATLQGFGTNKYATSTDGITWTDRTNTSTVAIDALTFGDGKFVAVNSGGGTLVSTNGLTWSSGSTGLSQVYGIAYGNGLFVAVSGNVNAGSETAYSTNGITWTTTFGSQSPARWYDVVYGNGLWVAIGWDATPSPDEVMTSPNGINWTLRSLAQSGTYLGIAFGPGLYEGFVGVGYETVVTTVQSRATVSRDGLTWF